jgi:hypothetical protein
MTKKLLFVTTLLLALTIGAFGADLNGKWTYSMQGRDGTPREVTITLKQDGNTLTGEVPGMGRGGAAPAPMQITNGKVDGDKFSFETKMEFNGNTRVTKYEGTSTGSELKMKVTRESQNGPQSTDVVAKKATT